jgi:hypothetical protein
LAVSDGFLPRCPLGLVVVQDPAALRNLAMTRCGMPVFSHEGAQKQSRSLLSILILTQKKVFEASRLFS